MGDYYYKILLTGVYQSELEWVFNQWHCELCYKYYALQSLSVFDIVWWLEDVEVSGSCVWLLRSYALWPHRVPSEEQGLGR